MELFSTLKNKNFFSSTYKNIKNNFFNFKTHGRATSKEFFDLVVLAPLILIGVTMIGFITSTALITLGMPLFITGTFNLIGGFALVISSFCLLISTIAIMVRRLHDVSLPGGWAIPPLFFSFIYFFTAIAGSIYPSKEHNKYGPKILDPEIYENKNLLYFVYFKYYSLNLDHYSLPEKNYNATMALYYRNLIPLDVFEKFVQTSSIIQAEAEEFDFSKKLPSLDLNSAHSLNTLKNSKELENIDFQALLSSFNDKSLKKRNLNSNEIELDK